MFFVQNKCVCKTSIYTYFFSIFTKTFVSPINKVFKVANKSICDKNNIVFVCFVPCIVI